MLDLNKIIENTDVKYHKYLTKEKIIIFKQIGSTNSYLLDCAKNPDNQLIFCLAEMQTAGRGRLNRNWSSPVGNIYLSILWKFNTNFKNLKNLSGLSLAIGVAISRTLAVYGVENISLKWPNDILYEHRKLAGVLIETIAGIKHTQAIIGIGMNINNASMLENDLAIDDISRLTTANKLAPKPFPKQFLMNITNNSNNIFDLNILLGKLIANILDILLIFEIQGLSPFVTEWQIKNYNLNKLVTIYDHNAKSIITGINKGIDNEGSLLIEKLDEINNQFQLIKIHSGEVWSIR